MRDTIRILMIRIRGLPWQHDRTGPPL
jgi:hypothetical protein